MTNFPTSFSSLTAAAEYVLLIHYRLEARSHLFGKNRTIDGTNLASIMMAENLIPQVLRDEIREQAKNEIHRETQAHTLSIIF
jgi:hypothetical protein